MSRISSCWALMIRAASVWTAGLAPFSGASRDMTSAWAWCGIMPVMKATSASE